MLSESIDILKDRHQEGIFHHWNGDSPSCCIDVVCILLQLALRVTEIVTIIYGYHVDKFPWSMIDDTVYFLVIDTPMFREFSYKDTLKCWYIETSLIWHLDYHYYLLLFLIWNNHYYIIQPY